MLDNIINIHSKQLKLKKYIQISCIYFLVLFSFSLSTLDCCFSSKEEQMPYHLSNSNAVNFKELTKDDIKKNHQLLRQEVNECYMTIGDSYQEYFNPGDKWKNKGNFSFQAAVNFCAVGVQWVIEVEQETLITPFEILKDSEGKILVASNTSSYQWKEKVLGQDKYFDNKKIVGLNKYHILSWPVNIKRDFYSYEHMKIDAKQEILESEKNTFLDFLRKIVNQNIWFSKLKPSEIETLKSAEQFFNWKFIYYNRDNKTPIDYAQTKRKKYNIDIFLDNYNKGNIPNHNISQEDLELMASDNLEDNPGSSLTLYAHLINKSKDEYKDLNNNPIEDIKKIYPSYIEEDMDIFHSESLFSWIINQDIESKTSEIKEKFSGSQNGNVFPIYYFYTTRQTCPSCENIVQKNAFKKKYVPLIAFQDTYFPEYILTGGFKLNFPQSKVSSQFKEKKINYPYTAFLMLPNFDLPKLKKVMTFSTSLDTQLNILKIDEKKNLDQNINFMKQIEISSKERATNMKQFKKNLENNTYPEELKNISENSDLPKIYKFNEAFQKIMLEFLNHQIDTETKTNEAMSNFILKQEKDIENEIEILECFRNQLHRIPVQYRFD